MEPAAELGCIDGRQLCVALFFRELDDRRGTQAAIEVVVEEHLGGRPDRFERDHVRRKYALAVTPPLRPTGVRRVASGTPGGR